MIRAPLMLLAFAALASGCPEAEEGAAHEGHEAHRSEGEGHARSVQLSPAAMKRQQIRTGEVKKAALTGGVEAPAELTLPPDRLAHVTPIVTGQLARVPASIGDRVQAGDVLAVMQSVELGETRSALDQARAEVEVAQANFDRQKELREENIGAGRDYQQAKADLAQAEARMAAVRRRLSVYGRGGRGASTPIRAPIDGVVLERHATVGEVAHPEDRLFVIGDPREVWVLGQVYPQDVERVREGARATLRLRAVAGRTWEGTLAYVAPALDPHTRTMTVRMVLDNPDGALRPGLFGTLSIAPADGSAEPVPVVERGAVVGQGGRDVVFVPTGAKGAFAAREVTLGAHDDTRVEVRKGLEEGDRYVTDGAFVLKSELEEGALGEGHAH